jgi:hypothetical protein
LIPACTSCAAVDIAIKSELKGDARLPRLALRRHLGDVSDLTEMPFQRRSETGRDDIGAGARQQGGH